jgi:predicted RNA binding protein YcfA (HicA-like mRNA interferase family)
MAPVFIWKFRRTAESGGASNIASSAKKSTCLSVSLLVVFRVYNTHMNSAEIIKQLLREGWVLRGVKGSHHIYTHPEWGGHISVPHPKKDLGIGLASKLLKQAGLK